MQPKIVLGQKLAAKNCPRTLLGWDNFCHDRSVFSSGDIAEDSKLPERDVGEAESSRDRGGLVGSDFLRICLVVGQAAVVDRRESDRGQPGSTGQCVSDHICLALDVAHVGGELRDKGEMSGLPR